MADGNQREFKLRFARVCLAECAHRRHGPVVNGRNVNRDFYWSLFEWAQRQRREAAAMAPQPAQTVLFA